MDAVTKFRAVEVRNVLIRIWPLLLSLGHVTKFKADVTKFRAR